MVENNFPKCPICNREILLPLSVSQKETAKVYGHWVCTNCGFCIGTLDTSGYNIPNDIHMEIFPEIVKRIEEAKRKYRKQSLRM